MPSINGEFIAKFLGERRVFLNGDSGPDQVRVVIADSLDSESGAQVCLKGEAFEGALRPGMIYRFYGRIVTHHKYGDQFHFSTFVPEKPADRESTIAYLRQCKGVGPMLAGKIFDVFGADAIDTLIREPDRIALAMPRFSKEQARSAAELLAPKERTRRTKVDLLGLLYGRGLPKKTIDKLIEDFGAESAGIVRRNPYILMRYRGCGFLKADRLYMELANQLPPAAALKAAARLKRQALCCWYAIASDSAGHTWYPSGKAREALAKQISGSDLKFERALALALRTGLLRQKSEFGTRWLAEARKADRENDVARCVVAAEQDGAAMGGPIWPDVSGEGLTDHQLAESAKALRGVIGILGGSPGTGKTYTSARIIKSMIALHGPRQVAVCAPTGKAAVRVTEAMQRNGVNLKAVTIHSLLKVQSGGNDGWEFFHGESSPLPQTFIVVDEASMIDTNLAASLLKARARGGHILFIGDVNQLAPVGHGAPLRDMIAAGVSYGELTEIQRNSGRIVRACAELRDHRRFTPSPGLDLPGGENLVLIERETPEEQIETLRKMLEQFLAAEPRKFDPVWDVQVLVAVNKRSPLGRKPLNKQLQDLLNFNGHRVQGNPFRVGDKIICTKNGYVPALDDDGNVKRERPPFDTEEPDADKGPHDPNAGKVYVANGEQAEVLQVEPNKTIARLTNPDRVVMIPRGTADDKPESDAAKVESGNGGEGDAEENSESQATGTGCNWELAYVISGHKSQGSEWPLVVILADEHNSARMVQSRNWLFTAMSRPKVAGWIIGKRIVVDEMCRRNGLNRKTFLRERIVELRGPVAVEAEENVFSGLLEGVC